MKKTISTLVLCSAIVLGLTSLAAAQPQGAMGGAAAGPALSVATLDDSLEVGTVKVSVNAGSAEKPLASVNVSINGPGKRVMRSDSNGQVLFVAMPEAEYTVSALVDGKPLRSEAFQLPTKGGVSIDLSTVPASASRGGRPSTRMMSGRARPEQNDPSGTLTVRAVQGELEQSKFGGLVADIPDGALIHLVGMHADGKMTIESKKAVTAEEGRVRFEKLKRDNSIAYYALTIFEREGGSDRMMTQALRLPPQVGSRMMFAGAPKDSASKGIDDLENFTGAGEPMPPAGVVSVRLLAETSQAKLLATTSGVELIQIGGSADALSAPVRTAGPSASTVVGQMGPMRLAAGTEAGQVSFYTVRPSTESALADVEIRLEPLDRATANTAVPLSPQVSGADGKILFRELEVGARYVPIAKAHGKEIRGEEFTVLKEEGQSFAFAFEWPEQDIREARFESVPVGADKVFIAKVFVEGRNFFSLPFQMTRERGAIVGIYMYPKILFTMHGGAELDDTRLWFQTQLSFANPGVAPILISEKGMHIPLPKGFVGASVADEMASRIGVESGKGFLWRGAVPPGQRDFVATFALPVSDGRASFDMALPYGLRSGRMVVEDLEGMELRTPAGAKVVKKSQPNGRTFLEMPDMNILPQQRLVFGVTGLPQESKLATFARVAVGVVVLLLVLWALFVIFVGRKAVSTTDPVLASLEEGREQLLQQMVKLQIEHRHNKIDEKHYQKNRDRLSSKLTSVYRKIDEHKESQRTGS